MAEQLDIDHVKVRRFPGFSTLAGRYRARLPNDGRRQYPAGAADAGRSEGVSGVDEAAVESKLGVQAPLGLFNDQVLKYTAVTPGTATEVRLKQTEQFAALEALGKNAVDAVREAHNSALAANENSQGHFYRAAQEQRQALTADLAQADLTWEQREALHDRLERNVGRVDRKDSENKHFQSARPKAVAAVGAAVFMLSLAFVCRAVTGAREGGAEGPDQD
ncbi:MULTISPECIES: hypothetical protein [Streptomyces]|uniref:DUF3618 domain-containing protein n=1 Tax=Streptomyces koyangensis TaxID=188770 RepID=A0ABX7EN70_9ACTN|nr:MULTISPECIES: hypothetical protein [Streptomyces]QRF05266.1 hypothetical protein G9U55_25930 [Streptomyces koyangensis]